MKALVSEPMRYRLEMSAGGFGRGVEDAGVVRGDDGAFVEDAGGEGRGSGDMAGAGEG